MPVVAFALGEMLYAVYAIYADDIELDYSEDVLADLVQFSLLFDPFRTRDLVVVDLSRLS